MTGRSPLLALACLFASAMLTLLGCPPPQATVTVLGENSSNLQAMSKLKSDFEKSNKGINIKFEAHTFEDAFQKAAEDFARGTGRYDIVLQYNFSLSSFARNDYVYTLEELKALVPFGAQKEIEEDLFPAAWKEVGFYYKDTLNPDAGTMAIGYPFAANTMLLAYNRDMFENASNQRAYRRATGRNLEPPTTWEDFYLIAKFFTSDKENTRGVCLQGAPEGWLYYEWMNFLFGMGGTMMQKTRGWEGNEETGVLLDSLSGQEAAKLYLRLKPFNSGDFFSTGAAEQVEVMLQGKTAMALMWSDYIYDFVQKAKSRGLKFGFTPTPGNKSMLAGGIFYINKKSKHPKEAAAYVMHLMQKEQQVKLMRKGLCSAVRSAYDDTEVKQLEYTDALRKSLERGVYMLEAGPEANIVQVAVTEHLQRAWRGEEGVGDALFEARRQIEARRAEIWKSLRKPDSSSTD